MDWLKQPHDKYFKATFGKVELARDFMINYLPQELLNIIDMNTLEPQKEGFLDEELKDMYSDLLFKVNINGDVGYIHFLFEHKSYRDRLVIFQILKYMLSIWESKIKIDKDRRKESKDMTTRSMEIPVILPLVVYHDEGKWNIKKSLGEMISNYKDLPNNIKKYIPNFEYLLFDLSEWNKEDIKLQSETIITIKALSRTRHASREEAIKILIEAIQLINETEKKDLITYYVSACVRYMLSIRDDISEEEMREIADRISTEGGELVMSVAEKLRQEGIEKGIELGRQEGRQEGRREERIEMAKNLIRDGVEIELVAKYTKLTEKEIEKIKSRMNN